MGFFVLCAVSLGFVLATQPNYADVMKSIDKALTKSQSQWPADYGHYGPLLIRLAWHCSGSHRTQDGRGGCDGARIRFDPERSWPDNANLDKARGILIPLKKQYPSISWGDLIVLAGTTAIKSMGGPFFGFCGGRKDDPDGTASLPLGSPSEHFPGYECKTDGNCTVPFGTTTVGLIYVNPEGPMGLPDRNGSAPQIRDTFGRMGLTDRETVALIGGGHSFGKTHGACPNGGDGTCHVFPKEAAGKGDNTFTSGFEGAWTSNPTRWGNEYFQNLLRFNYTVFRGPGGHFQWHVNSTSRPTTPRAGDASSRQDRMMLTSDLALLQDPQYLALVKEFSRNVSALADEFGRAWYHLTTSDMGPPSRCLGDFVPMQQPWQQPDPSHRYFVNISLAKTAIRALLRSPSLRSSAIESAWNCTSTYRLTDYRGGCGGVKPPRSFVAVAKLVPSLSNADLVVLGAQVSLEMAGHFTMDFCQGRPDAIVDPLELPPARSWNITGNLTLQLHDQSDILGLPLPSLALVMARPRLNGLLSNEYFKVLQRHNWHCHSAIKCVSDGTNWVMTASDVGLKNAAPDVVAKYVADDALFVKDFPFAWKRFVDRQLMGCSSTVVTAKTR